MQFEIPIATQTVQTVSEITEQIQRQIERHPPFRSVWVQGELSNVRYPKSGHVYFTLKDRKNHIDCALFQSYAAGLKFRLRDGEEVLVKGAVSIYGPHGKYQIRANAVDPIGEGALHRAFEALKARLDAEGLFDAVHKKPIPEFPKKIGVITSGTGAAFQDICELLRKRYPVAEVVLYPTRVQGDAAAGEITEGLQEMCKRTDVDVLIVGRGGGPLEDLWAFNEEAVVRAIFAATTPVVSAVGHEIDFTLSDFVADKRAPTPSAAVELVAPDTQELARQLRELEGRLGRKMAEVLDARQAGLKEFESHLSPKRRREAIYHHHQTLDNLESTAQAAIKRRFAEKDAQLQSSAQHLHALSPLATLQRGYSIARTREGQVLTAATQVGIGDNIEVQLSEGRLTCRVEARTDTD